jgi:hypothetical protein
VPKDQGKAISWPRKAAGKGLQQAKDALVRLGVPLK